MPFVPHRLAMFRLPVHRRIDDYEFAFGPQAAAQFGERVPIVRRVVDRRIEHRQIHALLRQRQEIELGINAPEGCMRLIVATRGQAVQFVAQNIDRHRAMTAQSHPIRKPAVARAQIGHA